MPANTATERPLRVAIIDDEPPARRRLRALLEPMHAEIAGEAGDGRTAVELIETQRPDVVLLDVEMPVADGFDVIEALDPGSLPLVIFVTAFDQYAIRAFDVHAIDYLLKPVEASRLSTALQRARGRLRTHTSQRDELALAIAELRRERRSERLAVKHDGRITFVSIRDIDFITAEGNYARVRTAGGRFLIRSTLTALEQRLAGHGFLRVHRGILVQTDRIAELQTLFHGEYAILLRNGTRLVSGRSYRERIRAALELTD